MTPNTTQRIKFEKYRIHFLGPRVPNFHPFHYMISHFQDIAHFKIFLLTSMLNFHSATKFSKLGKLQKKSNNLCSPMVANVLVMFG